MYVFSALRVSKQKKKNINVNKEQDIKDEDEEQYSRDVQSEGLRLSNSHIERENEEMEFGGKCGDEIDAASAVEMQFHVDGQAGSVGMARCLARTTGVGRADERLKYGAGRAFCRSAFCCDAAPRNVEL